MKVLSTPIEKRELLDAEVVFDGPMVKAVVDIKRGLMGIDANMHADIEQQMLFDGAEQDMLWGMNLYPEDADEDFIEFDSMINIRPRQHNRSRDVEDAEVREKITEVVRKWVK